MDLTGKIRNCIRQFEILTPQEVELLVEQTIADQFVKGTLLLKTGEIPTKCYMLVEGCVREYQLIDGEEKTTAFYTEGDTFSPFLDGEAARPSKHNWECLEDCVLTISNKDFEHEIRALLPRLDTVFQHIAIHKLAEEKERWSRFITSSPEERYLNLLETRPSLLNRVPHHQIASYLGMKPPSLSRIRKRIQEKRKQAAN